ncbi:hypothetical protein ABXJ56_06565 [Microbacterium chocolatum]|uniref:hypothetical protein n=1 Tax=Microbacterium aurantiacum TaxID=162393 RepID=UPI00338F8F11
MDNGSFFSALFIMPIVVGLLVGGLVALLGTLVAVNLGLSKLVGFLLDRLVARIKGRAARKRALSAAPDTSDPKP